MTRTSETAGRLEPVRPREVGIAERAPDMSGLAAAHVLANEAHDVLGPRGFTHEQLLAWAESYLEAEHSGDLETFLEWIDHAEHPRA